MKNQKPCFAALLAILIALSSIALIQLQTGTTQPPSEKSFDLSQINEIITAIKTLHPTHYNTSICSQNLHQNVASNSTRANINSFIAKNPGIEFRGICTGLGLAIGTVQFHIQVMQKSNTIFFVRDGKYKHFFASKSFSEKELKLLTLMRHPTIKKTLQLISKNGTVKHSILASDLKITSQGLSWQMRKLKNQGIIAASSDGIRTSYSINTSYKQILTQLLKEGVL